MRRLRPFEYFRPDTLDEALDLARQYGPRARVFAGGTDVLVNMKRGRTAPEALIDIKGIAPLDHFGLAEDGSLTIGALFTVDAVARRPEFTGSLGLLRTAALAIGHPQVRVRATVVGNLCNGSPSADMAPPLLALNASLRIANRGQVRIVPLSEFHIGPFKTILQPGDIVTGLVVPPLPQRVTASYRWLPKTTHVDETLAGAAVVVSIDASRWVREARIALGSLAPTPIRARKAEEFLVGQRADLRLFHEAARIAAAETRPRRRAEYRQQLTRVLLERSLTDAFQAAS